MKNRSSQLKIENRLLQVIPNAKTSNIIILTDTLNSFYQDYNLNANTKPQLNEMTFINKFTKSSDHCLITEYSLEEHIFLVSTAVKYELKLIEMLRHRILMRMV